MVFKNPREILNGIASWIENSLCFRVRPVERNCGREGRCRSNIELLYTEFNSYLLVVLGTHYENIINSLCTSDHLCHINMALNSVASNQSNPLYKNSNCYS